MREIRLFKKDGVYCVNRQDEDIHVPTRISDKLLKIGNSICLIIDNLIPVYNW